MGTNWIVASFRNAVRRFRGDTGGNTVITFALALLPIMGLIGAAYDYSRASSIRTAMQAAVDITALKLAQNASTDTTLSQDANTYFLAVFTNTAAKNASATATYSNTNGGTVVVTATANYTPLFMGVMNLMKGGGPRVTSIALSTSGTANWSTARLRVALVLDNTGSMSQASKLTTLQTALTSTSSTSPGLLTQLKNASSTAGDVYVSIIPFVKDSNVNSSNNGQPWIDWTDWEAEPADIDPSVGGSKPSGWSQVGPGSNCPFSSWNGGNGYGCNKGPQAASSTSTIPSSGNYKGLICPGLDNGNQNAAHGGSYYNGCYDSTQYSCTGSTCTCTGHNNCTCSGSGSSKTCATNSGYYEHTWRPSGNTYATPDHTTWNGCTTDRGISPRSSNPGNAAGNDETVTAPSTSDTTTLYPAEQYSMCPVAAVMGLNYDWSSMTTLVNSMTANGNTNQAMGLQLGWMSLVGGGPFTMPAEDPSYTYEHYIILLTDGLNTQDRWYGTGDDCTKGSTNLAGSPLMCMDQRQAQLCDNIKKSGTVTIYAIQVDTDGEAQSNLLKYCSGSVAGQGDPTHAYWLLTSASQITATFSQIGSQISKLHIAK